MMAHGTDAATDLSAPSITHPVRSTVPPELLISVPDTVGGKGGGQQVEGRRMQREAIAHQLHGHLQIPAVAAEAGKML